MEATKHISARAQMKAATKARHAQIRADALAVVNRLIPEGFSDLSLPHQLAWDRCARRARALAHRQELRIKDLKCALDLVARVPTMTHDQCAHLLADKVGQQDADPRQLSITEE